MGQEHCSLKFLNIIVRAHQVIVSSVHPDLSDLKERLLGKGHDLIETAPNLAARLSEQDAVQEDVLTAVQFGVKPRTDLKERADPATGFDHTRRRMQHTGDQAEGGALARSVLPDQPQAIAAPDFEAQILQRVKRRPVDMTDQLAA